jgi:hypothetical protein
MLRYTTGSRFTKRLPFSRIFFCSPTKSEMSSFVLSGRRAPRRPVTVA